MERFLVRFTRNYLPCNFDVLRNMYTENLITEQERCWDYLDFREILVHGLSSAFGSTLLAELSKEWWFDKRYYPLDEIIEILVSSYVLNQEALQAEM